MPACHQPGAEQPDADSSVAASSMSSSSRQGAGGTALTCHQQRHEFISQRPVAHALPRLVSSHQQAVQKVSCRPRRRRKLPATTRKSSSQAGSQAGSLRDSRRRPTNFSHTLPHPQASPAPPCPRGSTQPSSTHLRRSAMSANTALSSRATAPVKRRLSGVGTNSGMASAAAPRCAKKRNASWMASAAAAAARPEGGREERSEHWQFKPAGQAPQAAALPHLPLASCTTQCLPARQQCPAAHSLSASTLPHL